MLAFRLAGQHLVRRLPDSYPGSLLEAAGACGIQNTPPGSAALALHARVAGLGPAAVDRALETDRHLLQVWSVRGAPHVVPAGARDVFTIGLLPGDEPSSRALVRVILGDLDAAGLPAAEAIRQTAQAVTEALDGRTLSKDELLEELKRRLPRELNPWCRRCRIHHVHPSLQRAAALWGTFCLAPRTGQEASFVRTDQWLGVPAPAAVGSVEPAAVEDAGTELVRRFLRVYGPSTPSLFAVWAGIAPAHARRLWDLVASELVELASEPAGADKGNGRRGRQRVYLHGQDVARFESPPAARGVRLLPPHDPYLEQPDRETLLPDRALQAGLWRAVANPGAVLVDGAVVGTWRAQKKGARLTLAVEPFPGPPLHDSARQEIEAEGQSLLPYRDARSVEVVFAP
jgi:hypothetical protein